MNREQFIRAGMVGIGAVIGASVGAALGDVGEGIVLGVAVAFFAILPGKLYSSPAEFYLLTRFGPRAAKLYLAIAVPWVYLFLLTAGVGSAYVIFTLNKILAALFVLAVTLLANSIWTRLVLRWISLLRSTQA